VNTEAGFDLGWRADWDFPETDAARLVGRRAPAREGLTDARGASPGFLGETRIQDQIRTPRKAPDRKGADQFRLRTSASRLSDGIEGFNFLKLKRNRRRQELDTMPETISALPRKRPAPLPGQRGASGLTARKNFQENVPRMLRL